MTRPSRPAPPSSPEVIPRPTRTELPRQGLIERIEAAIDAKIVALIAPSGFGKSTLMAQYVRVSSQPTLWIHLQADDADPQALFDHLLRAVLAQTAAVQIDESSRTPEQRLEQLARRLNDQPTNFNLVFDGLNQLGLEAKRALGQLIAGLTEGHRVFLSGYDLEHLRLARSVADGGALVLGPADLAFDRVESDTYLVARGFTGDLDEAFALLDGWPAGLALVAANSSPHITPANLVLDALDALPSPLRRRIAEAAVLEVWSEAAAFEVGCDLPSGWVLKVQQVGLPIAPLGADRFRPHQLLIDTLERELRLSVKRHARLHALAGRLCERQGQFVRATQHYCLAGDRQTLMRAVHDCSLTLIETGRFHLLLDILRAIPQDDLDSGALVLLARCHLEVGQSGRAESLLHQLVELGFDSLELTYTRCLLAARRGQYQLVLELCHQIKTLESVPARISFDALRAVALVSLGSADLGRAAIERALAWSDTRNNPYLSAAVAAAAQFVYLALGDTPQRERYLQRGIDLFRSLGEPTQILELYNDLADRYRQQGRFAEAESLVGRALALVQQEPNAMQALLQEVRGDLWFFKGQLKPALETYEQALMAAESYGIALIASRIRLKLSEVCQRSGRKLEGRHFLTQAQTGLGQSPPWLQAFLDFRCGQIAFDEHQFEQAEHYFTAAIRDSLEPSHRVRGRAYQAELARRRGTLEADRISALFRSADAIGSDSALLPDLDQLNGLIRHCQLMGWSPERWQGLIRCAESGQLEQTRIARPRLEIRTLGGLQILFNGCPIRLPFAKAGELLVWLALHAPTTRDRALEALWTGSDHRRNIEYFKLTVRRLRSCLSEQGQVAFNPLPYDVKQYRLASDIEIWLDLEVLSRLDSSATVEDLKLATATYAGSFLPHSGGEWVETLRMEFHDRALAALLRLGGLLLPSNPTRAGEVFERALALDNLHEAAHLGAIEAAWQGQDRQAAWRLYRRYAAMLRDEFGVVPENSLSQRFSSI